MHLIANSPPSKPYELEPPANLTGYSFNNVNFTTYFAVYGDGKDTTFITIEKNDYDSMNILGDKKISVMLYVSGPNTEFNLSKTTGTLESLPDSGDDSVLMWIRNGASVNIEEVLFKGPKFPKYLFEHSGGSLTLVQTEISPDSESDPIKGSILFWNAVGRTDHSVSHDGKWAIIDCKFQNITLDSDKGLLYDDPSNPECIINVLIRDTSFINISSDYSGITSGRFGNAEHKALVFNYGNTKGRKDITTATFRNLKSKGYLAPLALLNTPNGGDVYTGTGLTITDCKEGSGSGTIAAFVSICEENTVFELKEASNNYVTKPGGTPEASNEITPMTDDVDVDCSEDTKSFPIWLIVIIIVAAVVVVAVVVVIVAVAVYAHKKKYSTLSDEEDYNESSSSSLRSAEKDNDDIDTL